MADDYLVRIGKLIRDARQHRGWTQSQLAEALGTSQSAVNRIERGNQNISLEMIARIGEALDSEIVSLGYAGPMHLRVVGGRRLSGAIDVKTSKNACVALLCASLLNEGRTVLRRVARIEEVYRLLEVLSSIGVRARWINDGVDLEIVPPAELTWRRSTRTRPAAPAPSSCSSARCCTAWTPSSCPTPAAATWARAPSSRT
jgi:UDP-N-acetylglucosamine 1-carboxyvinyltransferase